MNNISNIKNCYGCGICSVVCPKRIIDIRLNSNGFYEPFIKNQELCNQCGLCLKVCSYNKTELSLENSDPIKSFAAWSNNFNTQLSTSSGGVVYELGKKLINNEYKVCGVKYDTTNQRAEHYISKNTEELVYTKGSKYIQSYTPTAFRLINKKEKYLIIGTPCQIDSFRRYLKIYKIEKNFVLLDFFCHSVPSMLVWKYYIRNIKNKVGKIQHVEWRNKSTGWHDSWAMYIKGEKNNYNSRLSKGDIFYKLFLGDYYCNPACQNKCKYKYKQSSADIRVGDLWGKTYEKNEKGVSALIAFTQRGVDTINLMDNCTLIEHTFETVAEGQMKKNAGKAYLSNVVQMLLKYPNNIPFIIFKFLFLLEELLKLPHRFINKIKNTFK